MHRYTDEEVDDLLVSARVVQPILVSAVVRFSLFIAFVALSGTLAFLYQSWLVALPHEDPRVNLLPNGAQLGTVLLAAVAAIFAYFQWADSRRESSLEKFYERLKLTNERYNDWPHARALVSHFWNGSCDEAEFQRRMYTFLELDNLEYMLLRYQLGFVRRRLIRRAIRTFASRCESSAFRNLAEHLASGSGYDEKTKSITTELTRRANERSNRKGYSEREPLA